jgi:cytoskeletal protein RodZ
MDFKRPPRGYYVDYQPRQQHQKPQPAAAPPLQPPKKEEPPKPEEPAKPKKHKTKRAGKRLKRLILPLIILLMVAALVWLVHGYMTTRSQLEAAKSSKTPPTGSQKIIDRVALLVDLPQGEQPTIATVNDASKLKTQQFFARAQDGDKVLIYNKSGFAVLYRPSTNRVIEYSKVNINTSNQNSSARP